MKLKHLIALAALALSACVTAPPQGHPPAPRPVLLISIDGFRPDYLTRGLTPALTELAASGVSARMRPSFPSVTFPNHYTLVTGVRPDRHGIVNNTMEDPDMPGVVFTLRDRAVAHDPRWWNGAEPIWVSAERAGIATATMFWPGSDVEIRGVRPHDWELFDQAVPSNARVDRVLGWLDRPAPAWPRFLTLYFDIVDTAGHGHGPDSAELNEAVRQVDGAIAHLVEGLRARRLYNAIDLVIVSDHGMAAVSRERAVNLDEVVDPGAARLVWSGLAFAALAPAAGHESEVEARVLGRHGNMECWRKDELPARFHFGANRRIPPIFCLADAGWIIVSPARADGHGAPAGLHGFDPDDPSMTAFFLAHGPDFRRGRALAPIDNVDVYPLLAHLIGVHAQDNDGDLSHLAPALTH